MEADGGDGWPTLLIPAANVVYLKVSPSPDPLLDGVIEDGNLMV